MPALELKPLEREDIESLALDAKDIWYVKLADDVYGPYETMSLRDFAAQNEPLFKMAEVAHEKNANEWHDFIQTPPFNRKPPKFVSAKALHLDDKLYLHFNGQKHGPYKVQDVKNLLTQEKVSLLDLVSMDEGYTWMKVSQHPAFEDHAKSADDLPRLPGNSHFEKAQEMALEKIYDEGVHVEDQLATLAYLDRKEHKESEAQLKLDEIQPLKKGLEEKEFSFWKIAGGLITASAVAAFWVVNNHTVKEHDEHHLDSADTVAQAPEHKKPQSFNRRPASEARIPSHRNQMVDHNNYNPYSNHTAQVHEDVTNYQPDPEPAPIQDPAMDDPGLVDRAPAEEAPLPEAQPVDPAMDQPPQEPVQEVGDF